VNKFCTVYIDPPWQHVGGKNRLGMGSGANHHYATLPVSEIPEVIRSCPYWKCVSGDAHLWLWSTNFFLPGALQVVRELGFRYVNMVTWDKQLCNLGHWFTPQTEHCLFSVRGSPRQYSYPCATSAVSGRRYVTGKTLISERRTRHSAKPLAMRKMIEKMCRPKFLEIFAREKTLGWTTWGDEI